MSCDPRSRVQDTSTRIADEHGVVMIEFVIAFVPIFVLFLGSVQLALLSVARLVAQHAAVAGARSASVVLDDDPRFYGAPRGDISEAHTAEDDGFEQAVAERVGADTEGSKEPPSLGGPRMAAIRRAVHMPLAAIAPEPWLAAKMVLPLGRPSLEDVLGNMPSLRLLSALTAYLPITTAVTFPKEPGAKGSQHGDVETDGSVTVRVTHVVPCVVPVVGSLLCQRLTWDLRHSTLAVDGEPDEATQEALSELSEAPQADAQWLLVLGDVPVKLLRVEATLPAQTAPYRYLSERKEEKKE
ncbi:MAG: TadE/TadG family type IV pilus assembly protein [Polyangiales bacterium]